MKNYLAALAAILLVAALLVAVHAAPAQALDDEVKRQIIDCVAKYGVVCADVDIQSRSMQDGLLNVEGRCINSLGGTQTMYRAVMTDENKGKVSSCKVRVAMRKES